MRQLSRRQRCCRTTRKTQRSKVIIGNQAAHVASAAGKPNSARRGQRIVAGGRFKGYVPKVCVLAVAAKPPRTLVCLLP